MRLPSVPWETLTPAEKHLGLLVRQGLSNKEIASRLAEKNCVVRGLLHNVFVKLGIQNRVQLAELTLRITEEEAVELDSQSPPYLAPGSGTSETPATRR